MEVQRSPADPPFFSAVDTVVDFFKTGLGHRYRSDAELQPLLADFDQPVAKLRFEDGTWTGLFRHVLKVFLLDGQHRVRNVYSVGFFNPALVLNDVRTLLLESSAHLTLPPPRE